MTNLDRGESVGLGALLVRGVEKSVVVAALHTKPSNRNVQVGVKVVVPESVAIFSKVINCTLKLYYLFSKRLFCTAAASSPEDWRM